MKLRKIVDFSIGPIGAAIISFVILPVIAWWFNPEDIGRLSMLTIAITFSLLLFSLGLDQAYVREFYEYNDKYGLLKSVFCPGFVLIIIISVCFLYSSSFFSEFLFDKSSVFLSAIVYISIVLSFISRFLSLILRMEGRGLACSMSQLLPKLIFFVSIIIYIWLDLGAEFDFLVLANFISIVFVFLIFLWNTRNSWKPAIKAKVDKQKQFQMIRYGLPLIGGGVAFWGLTASDKLFLRNLSSFEELGIYSMSASFAGVALVFKTIFSTIWAPVVYQWASTKDGASLKVKEVIDYVALAMICIWCFVGMLSWVIPYFLPEQYAAIKFIVLSAIAYPIFYTISEVTGVGINIQRRTIFSFFATIVALVVNLFANWLLVPMYGAKGAAIGSAISFFIFFIIKTEASIRVWEKIERIKIYFFLISLLVLSIMTNVGFFVGIFMYFYGFIFLLSLILYINNVKGCVFFVFSCLRKINLKFKR